MTLQEIIVFFNFKSWKQVSHFVPFQSDVHGLIIWDHWINSAESQEPCTASPAPDCVPQQSLRAFLSSSVKCCWKSCISELNNVELNVMWATKPALLWKRFKKLEMFYCNFCKCILELKCVFYITCLIVFAAKITVL